MGSNIGSPAKGYLYRLLADGARPFRYRSRVRTLLGFPECGIEMNFSKPLPIAGFSYVVPRFMGEFEFPDDVVSAGSRLVVHAEEMTSSARRTSGIPPQGERARRRSATDLPSGQRTVLACEVAIEEQRRPAPRRAEAASGETRSGESARGGNRVNTAPGEIGPARTEPALQAHDVSLPGTQARRHPAAHSGEGLAPHGVPPPIPDVVLPGIPARRDSAAHSGEDRIGELTPTNLTLPASSEPAADSASATQRPREASTQENRSKTADAAPPARPAGIPVGHAVHGVPSPIHASGSAIPERPFPQVHSVQRSSSQAPHDPPPARRESPRVRTESRSDLPPHLRAETVATHGRPEQTVWDAAGMPAMRHPNRASHQSRPPEIHQRPPAAASNLAPVVPSAQTPVIVVQPGSGSAVTSPAFWERRHLTNLRLRIRR
jgi:hypothetical protein